MKLAAPFVVALSIAATACGGTSSPVPTSANAPSPGASAAPVDVCHEISSACHKPDHDGGTSLIHDCHTLGHAHQVDACVARKAECLAACGGASK